MGPVQADQFGQGVCVARVALGAGRAVPLAVAGHLQRIDRVDGVTGGDQRLHPGPTVGLDPDQHLGRFGVLGEVVSDQGMQPGQPIDPFGQPPLGQRRPSSSTISMS
jgi:hypothetical protein